MKIGHGYDVHRFGGDKPLMLGCTHISDEYGLIAHSDGDVVCHALCDSLLGAAGERDIGVFFPDNDKRYENASGAYLLAETAKIIRHVGYGIINADITVVAEKPRLSAFIIEMRTNMARALDVDPQAINIKATTEEGLGIAGKGIACHAVCLLEKEEL